MTDPSNNRPRLERSLSFSAPTSSPMTDDRSKPPTKGSAISSLFKKLVIAKEPVAKPSAETSRGSLRGVLSGEKSPRAPSDLENFQQYLSTLFTNVQVVSDQESLRIIFTSKSKNSPRTTAQCLPEKIIPLLTNQKVCLEISLEAFICSKEWRYAQFLEEIAPYLAALKCFPVVKKTESFKEKWTFPKLEVLDVSRCNLTKECLQNLCCENLQTLKVRKIKSLPIEDLVSFPSALPSIQEIEFSKSVAISREQLDRALDLSPHNLLFFLRSAKKHHHKALEERCQAKLKEHFGQNVRLSFSEEGLLCTLFASQLRQEIVKKVFHAKMGVQIKLILQPADLQNAPVKQCLQWFNEAKISHTVALQLSQASQFDELATVPSSVSEVIVTMNQVVTSSHLRALFKTFPTLQGLSLAGCQIEEGALKELQLPQVAFLSLGNTTISDADLLDIPFQEPNVLRHLVLDNTLVSSKGFVALKKLAQLELLSLAGCHKVSEETALLIAKHCPQLRHLSFHSSKGLTEKMVAILLEHCTKLRSLDARVCKNIPKPLKAVLYKPTPFHNVAVIDWSQESSEQTKQLVSRAAVKSSKLCLTNCEKVTDEMMLAFISKTAGTTPPTSLSIHDFAIQDAQLLEPLTLFLSKLQKLDLKGPLGYPGVIQLAKLKNIVALSLSNDQKRLMENFQLAITDDGLEYLSKGLIDLEQISLDGFTEITAKGLGFLLENCHRLRRLQVNNCPKISKEAFEALIHQETLAFIECEHSAKPYHIELRNTTQEDREKRADEIDREMDTLGILVYESPTSSPEALQHMKSQETALKRKIQNLTDSIPTHETNLQEACTKLFQDMQEAAAQYVPNMCRDCITRFSESALTIPISNQVVTQFRQLLEQTSSELEERKLDLIDLEGQHEQGEQFRTRIKGLLQGLVQERESLATKAFVMTVTSTDYRSIKPIESMLAEALNAQEPAFVKLREKIMQREGQSKKFSFTLLFTSDEINKFSALGLFKEK